MFIPVTIFLVLVYRRYVTYYTNNVQPLCISYVAKEKNVIKTTDDIAVVNTDIIFQR